MLSYHFYPRNYGFTTARDTEIWIERHQAIAALTGKVAYLGECGFVAPDQERGQTYDGWLRHLFAEADGQLGLFWQLSPAARTNNDGFAVYSRRDSATAWILSPLGPSHPLIRPPRPRSGGPACGARGTGTSVILCFPLSLFRSRSLELAAVAQAGGDAVDGEVDGAAELLGVALARSAAGAADRPGGG